MNPQMRARCVFDDVLNTMSFQCLHVEIVANTQVFEGVRHPRARVARMVLFDTDSCDRQVRHARARAARVASWDRDIEHVLVFL